ncbi:MAG: hypothetical protein HY870_18545, partial [Chloroflexi bacterium]|nr:hypothetical protein [Chloroflexota bacterium]
MIAKQWTGADELILARSNTLSRDGVVTVTDALTRATVDAYASGLWLGGTDAASQAITRTYDANFKPTHLADANGHGTQIEWSANGFNPARIIGANGYSTTMSYDAGNNLTQTVDARGFTTTFTYSGTFLTRKVDAVGSTWLYTPTADGRNLLAAELAPGGRLTEYQYDQFGQRSVVTDALKGVTRYGYDPVGRLITITDSLGRITVNAYDKADQLIAVTANFTTTGGVDPNAFNLTTRYGYDGFGRQIAVTDTLQHVTRNYYDRAGRLISVTVNFTTTGGVDPTAYNLTTRYGYDAVGNQIAITDTLGRVTHYEYDALDRMIATTDPMTGTTRYGYDAAGHQTDITDPSGIATTFDYDALGRLIKMQDARGSRTAYEYDGVGNRIAITDANGLVTRYAYDPLSRLISVTENYSTTGLSDYQTNVTTRYGYDAIGNRTVITNARSQTTTYTYDALSRLVAETNPLLQVTRHQYDAVSNRVVMTDAKNQVTRYGYDGLNRLVVITYTADATTVKYAYDALGNRTALTDTTGTTTYRYDALSRPLTVTSPLTGAVGYRYNAVGNRTHLIYPDGKVVTYTYDAANRLTGVSPWSSSPVSYTYDAAGRPREVKVGGALTTRYGYDAAGRLTWLHHLTATPQSGAQAAGSAAFYSYRLDAVGNRIQVIESRDWPWKAFLPLILNGSTGGGAMMMSAPMMPSAPIGSSSSTFASPLAAPQSFTSPLAAPMNPATPTAPGSSSSNTVPDLSMLLLTPVIVAAVVAQKKDRRWSVPIAVLAGILVTIGAAQSSSGAAPRPMPFLSPPSLPSQSGCSNPAAVPGGRVISYAYDPLYRLSAAAYSTGECYQYAYDKVGNRTTQTATITSTLVTTYAYDVADRLTSVNGQTYTWDNNGSLTNNGKFTFAYNNAGRMTQAQGITATQVYTYNGDGLLMNRNGARNVWDQAADLPQLLSDGTTLYVPGVGQWNGTSWAYELPDGLGSVRQLADAQGNIVQRYDYNPFGEVV